LAAMQHVESSEMLYHGGNGNAAFAAGVIDVGIEVSH